VFLASNKPGNYQGVYLLAMLIKIHEQNDAATHKKGIDEHLENAYRPGRSCQLHVLAAAQLRAIAKYHKIPAIFLFVDFAKAFDSLNDRP
jgi:hypothetical protein